MKGCTEQELVTWSTTAALPSQIRPGSNGQWWIRTVNGDWVNIGRSLAERIHIAASLRHLLPPDPHWDRGRQQLSTVHGRQSFWAEYRYWCRMNGVTCPAP